MNPVAPMNAPSLPVITDEMVSRFLGWRLPDNFSPDCGITFKREYNEHAPWGPNIHEPVGTNLLDADQARAMLEHVLGGAVAPSPAEQTSQESILRAMARNYGDGRHQWDKLDRIACERAADEIRSLRAASAPSPEPQPTFQQRVQPWMMACFGPEISSDTIERNHRFLEESLELVQSTGCTASEAHQLVDYVYGRPAGEPVQEVGGVLVTLAALCLAQEINMHSAGETELARIWTKVDVIRAKQAAKPKHSPLPGVSQSDPLTPSATTKPQGVNLKLIPKEVRDQFEDYAYRNYQASRLSAALQTTAKMRAEMTRAEYLKRDAKGEYVNASVVLLFMGWKLALDAMMPTLDAAHMWKLWADINDRIAAELPAHYSIVMGLEHDDPSTNSGFYIELIHFPPDVVSHSELSGTTTLKLGSERIEYPNPVDMDSPGLLQRTLESALEAAKAHHAKGLN